jgi:hypothetical protein
MNSSLRDMPRYIRNTDAFGWQGADHQNGPWRSIPAPQIGTPWQALDAKPAPPSTMEPSLKQQALEVLNEWCEERNGPGESIICDGLHVLTIFQALESLPD